MNKTKAFSGALLALAVTAAAGVRAELAVIVNPANAESALTADQAKDIYLGKTKKFPSGGEAVPVDQKDGSPARAGFYTKVVGKDESQLKAYWSKLIFSGKGTPPTAVDGDADVKAWVAKNPGGVGYVDKAAVDGSVKVLLTVP